MTESQDTLRFEYVDTEELPPNEVMYWSSRGEHLSGNVQKKAELLCRLECIHYVGDDSHLNEKGVFIALPINEADEIVVDGRVFKKKPAYYYNKTVYWMRKDGDLWICSCQGWKTKQKKGKIVAGVANCSHVLGLYHAFKNKRFGGGSR